MPELALADIARIVDGRAVPGPEGERTRFSDYCFDTRQMRPDSLFFALRTATGDGHRHLGQLSDLRGAGAVVASDFTAPGVRLPLIRVADPLAAAHRLAAWVRQQNRHTRYVAITGSAGKTTTKEFTYQILSSRFAAFRSPENWNNYLGLPFSLLKMPAGTETAVFELAMSDPGIGEIDRLVQILRPDVAIVLNVFPVHLEFLKNVENIATAKAEILNRLEADDIGLLNGDFPLLRGQGRRRGRIVYFGSQEEHNMIVLKEISRKGPISELEIDFYGIPQRFTCRLISRAQLENLFAAIVVCHHLGMKHVEIQEALEGLQPLAGRGVIRSVAGFSLVDETYNSNPEALRKMLAWVDDEYPQTKVAVVGDMLELGDDEERFHREAGEFFAHLRFQALVTVGARGEWIAAGARAAGFPAERIHSFAGPEEAGRYVRRGIPAGSVILLKASRGVHLEKAIEELANG